MYEDAFEQLERDFGFTKETYFFSGTLWIHPDHEPIRWKKDAEEKVAELTSASKKSSNNSQQLSK